MATERLRRHRHRWRPQRPGHGGLSRQGRPADAWSWNAGRPSAARPRPPSSRPARAFRRWPTPSAGCGRRSCASCDLKRHGLSLVGPDVRVFAPGPDGRCRRPLGRRRPVRGGPAGSLRRRTPDAYAAFDGLVRSLAGFLGEIAGQTPPDIEAPGLGDALAGLRLGRTFRGLGRHDGRTITRVLPMAIADFVAESFESDAVRAAIAWRGDPVHRDGAVVGRHDGGPARGFGRQRRRRRRVRPSSPAAARAPWRTPWRRPPGRPASRSGPGPRSCRSPRTTGAPRASSWPTARS